MRSRSTELEWIAEIEKIVGKPSPWVVQGIGDDGAVLKPFSGTLVATTDCLVEDIHFSFHYSKPAELGHKALAVNLSDLAAMGATPRFATVTLGLRQELALPFVREFYRGMVRLARRHGVAIVGGNLSRSPSMFFCDVHAVGEGKKGRGLFRHGARAGQWIGVTGHLGSSAAGFYHLKTHGRPAVGEMPSFVERHLAPNPRVGVGVALAALKGVGAAIDVSDGFASEIYHLADASAVGMEIEAAHLPIAQEVIAFARTLDRAPLEWALHGGEDYELLFTFEPKIAQRLQQLFRRLKVPFTIVGKVLSKKAGVQLRDPQGKRHTLPNMGWRHFPER